MKDNKSKNGVSKVRSFEDLALEKARLLNEVRSSEEGIRSGYHDILDRFTLSRITGSIVEQLATRTSVLSRAFAAGKKLFSDRKKKKKII